MAMTTIALKSAMLRIAQQESSEKAAKELDKLRGLRNG